MKEVRTVIYEAEDYDKLQDMSIAEVINALREVDDGWIGHSEYCHSSDYEGDADDYNRYRLHQALRLAYRLIESEYPCGGDNIAFVEIRRLNGEK